MRKNKKGIQTMAVVLLVVELQELAALVMQVWSHDI